MTAKAMLKTAEKFIIDNSPGILTGLGVAGTVTTAVLTGKAAYSSALKIAAANEVSIGDMKGELDAKAKFEIVWKEFIPPAAVGLATIASIIGANQIGSRRAAALAAAFKISEQLGEDYKKKVLETLGIKNEEKMRADLATDRMAENPPSKNLLVVSGSDVLMYDTWSGRYFRNTVERLMKAVNDINHKCNNFYYASLSDFYDMIGLTATQFSDGVGWNSDELLEIQLSATIVEDQPAISIEYNVEPTKGYDRCM